jgi:3-phosphoshikimate 1-carboxyvinyltransferase
LLDALRLMDADVTVLPRPVQGGEPSGDILVHSSILHACEISGDLVVRMIDEFPAFAVAAAYASGTTVVRDAQELRFKESDRISALCAELRKLNVHVQETPDGFVMQGGLPLGGGTLDPHGDHRLAMSLAVAGLASQAPVEIQEAKIIHESFPEFTPILQHLGARLNHT